jgi:hypothetical protein
MEIQLLPVQSNTMSHIGYDAETKTLAVQFRSGLYHYSGVPQDLYNEFMASESKGSFLNLHIARKFDSHLVPVKKEDDKQEAQASA